MRRDGGAVRLFTRRGYDWTERYPAIAAAAAKLRAKSFTVDGEAAVCGSDGIAVFDALHRRGTVAEAILYAFDLLEYDGEDLRSRPLAERKTRLAKLVGRCDRGIVYNEHTDEDGATVFRHACKLGLEGIVSKRLSATTNRAHRGTGSRSRTQTARRWCRGGDGTNNPARRLALRRQVLIPFGPAPALVVSLSGFDGSGSVLLWSSSDGPLPPQRSNLADKSFGQRCVGTRPHN